MRVLVVFGTRPEAIKLAPVIRALRQFPEVKTDVFAVRQHTDLLDLHLKELGIKATSIEIDAEGGSLNTVCASALQGVSARIRTVPDLVIVQGDTTTALAAALAAFHLRIPVAHVEAGLRTYRDNPFPEEVNRRLIAQIATLHFAPHEKAVQNLEREHVRGEVYEVGNPLLDQVERTGIVPTGKLEQVLVTLHRRETWPHLPKIAKVLKRLHNKDSIISVVWPAHPNPIVQKAAKASGVEVVPPMTHRQFLELLAATSVVITDSGGVIEEAEYFEKPTIVLRGETDREWGDLLPLVSLDRLDDRVESLLGESWTSKRAGQHDNAGRRIADLCRRWLHERKK